MNWVTVVWSMLIGGCIAIALPQLLIWMWQRRIVHLLFVILAAAKVALLWNELVLMHASSVEQFSQAVQWRQLPLFVMFAATVVFVRLYFDAGRWWLGIAAGGVRFACLVINFAFPPNLYFREITSLRPAPSSGRHGLNPRRRCQSLVLPNRPQFTALARLCPGCLNQSLEKGQT